MQFNLFKRTSKLSEVEIEMEIEIVDTKLLRSIKAVFCPSRPHIPVPNFM